jgi:NH3-dependent NAD+ synthetase
VLDRILEAYVERDEGIDALVAEGLPEETVMEVVRLVDRAEYKRRQAPPGIRVSTKAFGVIGACRSRTASARCGRCLGSGHQGR